MPGAGVQVLCSPRRLGGVSSAGRMGPHASSRSQQRAYGLREFRHSLSLFVAGERLVYLELVNGSQTTDAPAYRLFGLEREDSRLKAINRFQPDLPQFL